MFCKLFKYDFKRMGRWLLPVQIVTFGAAIVFGLMIRIAMLLKTDAMDLGVKTQTMLSLSVTLAVILATAIVAFVAITVFYEFYKSMASEEGYLTHTLPIEEGKIFLCKILTAVTWLAITAVVAVASILVFLLIIDGVGVIKDVYVASKDLAFGWQTSFGVLIAENVIRGAFSLISAVTVCYFSIILGSIVAQKAKVVAGLGIYFGILLVRTIIVDAIGSYVFLRAVRSLIFGGAQEVANIEIAYYSGLILGIVWCIVETLTCYFVGRRLLNKKLNLN